MEKTSLHGFFGKGLKLKHALPHWSLTSKLSKFGLLISSSYLSLVNHPNVLLNVCLEKY